MRLLILLICFIFVLVGCSNTNEQEAIAVAKKFKVLQYEIKDFNQLSDDHAIKLSEQLKPYLTEQAYTRFYSNRDAGYSAFFAKQNKSNIIVSGINFKKNSEDNNSKTIVYDFVMELLIKKGDAEKIISKNGQMSLVQLDGTWKIDSQWDEKLQQNDFN